MLKSERIALLDKYFQAASGLIAKLMRFWTEQTLTEMSSFLSQYKDGNVFQEPYHFYSGLALPHSILPFKYYLVADPGAANLVKIEPTPGETFLILDEIADLIVDSLKDLPRLELLLFENVREFMFLKYVNLVGRDDEIVLDFKRSVRNVVEANLYGFK